MKLNLNNKGYIDIDRSTLLSHHDVVFGAPVHDPTYGLPIGNGDVGCLIWTEEDKIILNLNKTDLWDDAKNPEPHCSNMKGDDLTTCRHGAQLVIDMGCPVFDVIYQKNYEGRLSLHDATASINADTPFSQSSITAFSSHANNVTAVKIKSRKDKNIPIGISLKRWGSRTLWFWYSNFNPDIDNGLYGTQSYCENGIMSITQRLNPTVFSVSVLPVSVSTPKFDLRGEHCVHADLKGEECEEIILYIAISASENGEDTLKASRDLVRNAAKIGFNSIYDKHKEEWKGFWSKSFISLSQESDYWENLWYLNLYYANSQMRGKYPAHFCNGIWGFYHDFVPWNHYFHYNMQLATFPLEASGHGELLETYYNFRFNQLPEAKEFARLVHNKNGAFYTDVCDRLGRNDMQTIHNCTCGPQLAMMLYNHYLYSLDKNYLYEKALPLMKAVGEFYLDMLTMGDDGYYHVTNTQCYEGSLMMDDSITDYAMIRALFTALVNELTPGEASPYKERLEGLAPYRYTQMYEDEFDGEKYTRGIGKGLNAVSNEVLHVGRLHGTDEWQRKTHGNSEHDTYGFPDTEMAPLFPSGTVGIKDKGTRLYNAIYNTVCLHRNMLLKDNALGREADDTTCMGWCMEPIYLARMGMGDLLLPYVENTINSWMIFPQGFGIYTPTDHKLFGERWNHYTVKNMETGVASKIPTWNFRHFDYETLPILSAAANEMLLQSYDGILRLFCAVEGTKQYAFSLHAVGGYTVDAIYNSRKFAASIYIRNSGVLRLAVENVDEEISFISDNGKDIYPKNTNGVYEIEVNAGEYIFVKNTNSIAIERAYSKNSGVKVFGDVKLGEYKAYM
ncbi:MAG: hypothetical protein E7315_03645 [Clostridiales bacterium]|nr:hypothetical protein [Clostridiales bacterium]